MLCCCPALFHLAVTWNIFELNTLPAQLSLSKSSTVPVYKHRIGIDLWTEVCPMLLNRWQYDPFSLLVLDLFPVAVPSLTKWLTNKEASGKMVAYWGTRRKQCLLLGRKCACPALDAAVECRFPFLVCYLLYPLLCIYDVWPLSQSMGTVEQYS